MTSLLDIGPLTEEVEIRGTTLTVQGLTAGHLFQMFAEFPDMRRLLEAKDGSPQTVLLSLAPELIAKIIAIATGEAGNKEVEAKAKTMGATDQLTILSAVQRISFPNGIGPFLDHINQLMGASLLNAALPTTDLLPSLKSSIKSRALSNASLQTDIPPLMSGRAPRAN